MGEGAVAANGGDWFWMLLLLLLLRIIVGGLCPFGDSFTSISGCI